ncbi:MAG TPA: NAD(P)H-binding protein [Anaerolineae bacterium]|nr:NAD(P)H-binding protein [Anaerolineae bacterium]HID85139.1 NAD-dependent epimerase/dehydratase family protein [Anaerolineales bacterium]HIQ08453.1 NAD-dependent epimerase/dehydratase family protein [Anaerolineaceae bacterium]
MRILITGGTGFVGQALVRHLVAAGHEVRVLLRPGGRNPRLPKGVPVEVALTTLDDPRGLRAALAGVEAVVHLAGGEWLGVQADLAQVDVQGTQALVEAALEMRVGHLIYLSHLGAEPASAYPVLRAKGLAEAAIRRSGVPHIILRSALAFGPGDGLTTGLALLLHAQPGFFLLPGDGRVRLQPLWIEDLAAALALTVEMDQWLGRTLEIGGPEQLTLGEIVQTVAQVLGLRRWMIPVPPVYLRWLTVAVQYALPAFPISTYWLDYLALSRTCDVDVLPREFGLMPERFARRLDYLKAIPWRRRLLATLFRLR